jgi:hypothetical protein
METEVPPGALVSSVLIMVFSLFGSFGERQYPPVQMVLQEKLIQVETV